MLSERKPLLLTVAALLLLPLLAMSLGGPPQAEPAAQPADSACCCSLPSDSADEECSKDSKKDCRSDACARCTNPICGKLVLFFDELESPRIPEVSESIEEWSERAQSRVTPPPVPPPMVNLIAYIHDSRTGAPVPISTRERGSRP